MWVEASSAAVVPFAGGYCSRLRHKVTVSVPGNADRDPCEGRYVAKISSLQFVYFPAIAHCRRLGKPTWRAAEISTHQVQFNARVTEKV